MKHAFGLLIGAAALLAGLSGARADDAFPNRPIKIIVAFAPGSATDATARVLAEAMRPILGQNVVVENRPGAFGIIAIEEMARSKPDGHTVMIGNVSTSALTPRLYRKRFTIDPDKDITPISRVSVLPGFWIVSAKHMPAKTFAEFIAYAKANPGKVKYSTTGVGAFTHYAGEMLQKRAGIRMVHIPMKEGPPAMVRDIMTGDIQAAEMTMATAAGLIKAGELRALAVNTDERVAEYPDIPTMAELGYPGIGEPNWSMMFVPAATPAAVQEKLQDAVSKALASPALKEAYAKQLIYPTPSASVAEAKAWLAKQMAKWGKTMSEVKIDLE
ncbi:MAG TPA: tripartite tricarboxylate transporter substrate binding protein [Xanthobacteraceae bacterium]|nr:tripartite tricarboxylate transporter substrate binding protein [Xanthobacteraceae bacterium]